MVKRYRTHASQRAAVGTLINSGKNENWANMCMCMCMCKRVALYFKAARQACEAPRHSSTELSQPAPAACAGTAVAANPVRVAANEVCSLHMPRKMYSSFIHAKTNS